MATSHEDWREFALLVIDMQRAFIGGCPSQQLVAFSRNWQRLLSTCRSEGVEVIHVRSEFRPDGADWPVRHRLKGEIPCQAGTEGCQTLEYARAASGELILTKQTYDAFLQPDLERHLQRTRKRFLMVAGLVTSVCVLFSAASAAQRGFLVALVEDCCADPAQSNQLASDRYDFLWERVTSGRISQNLERWTDEIERSNPPTTG